MTAFLIRNIYYYGSILIFMLVGGIILFLYNKADVAIWINTHYNSFLDKCFLCVNYGGTLVFSLLTALIVGFFKGWKTSLKAIACFASAALVVLIVKYFIFPGALRPTLYFEGKYVLRLIEGVVQLETESFPSGHTAAAFSVATFLALLLPKKQWHWLLALAAGSVGYARLYLSQHFITDVYTGMIIGVGITTLVYYFYPEKRTGQ